MLTSSCRNTICYREMPRIQAKNVLYAIEMKPPSFSPVFFLPFNAHDTPIVVEKISSLARAAVITCRISVACALLPFYHAFTGFASSPRRQPAYARPIVALPPAAPTVQAEFDTVADIRHVIERLHAPSMRAEMKWSTKRCYRCPT